MEEELQQTTPKALWLLIILPPAIGAAAMEADFVLVRQACAGHNVALYAVTIAGLALIAATAFIAFTIWKVEGTSWPTEAADRSTRIRFIAVLGILSSAMSFLLLLAQGIAMMLFDPCQW